MWAGSARKLGHWWGGDKDALGEVGHELSLRDRFLRNRKG